VPGPVIIVLVLDIEHGLGMQCRNNPELASMVLQTRWVKHFSRTRTTTRTRTIAGRGGARFSGAIRQARSGATSWLARAEQGTAARLRSGS
jgi:hypothetical protein